jgi:general secretion pathway protein A
MHSLEAFLIGLTSKGKSCLQIVDEAQNLSIKAVEELRTLSNFQFGNQPLLRSFLVGQPEFREILQSPGLTQFRQRIIASYHIEPMNAAETRAYQGTVVGGVGCQFLSGHPDCFRAALLSVRALQDSLRVQ